MTKKIQFSLKKSDGLISIRYNLNDTFQASLGFKIPPEHWDYENSCVKQTYQDYSKYNKILAEAKQRLQLIIDQKPATVAIMRIMWNNSGNIPTFLQFVDEQLDALNKRNEPIYSNFRKMLSEIDSESKLADIDLKWFESFVQTIRNRNYSEAYSIRTVKALKFFLKRAQLEGINIKDYFWISESKPKF